MQYQDYYKTLGVSRDATIDEIKKAYRRLARKYHPDVSKEANAEEQFKTVKEAYEVLKDPEKRAAYDQLGANWNQQQDFTPPPNWEEIFRGQAGRQNEHQHQTHHDFSDFFENLFGGAHGGFSGSHAKRAYKGEDIHSRLAISLQEAFSGSTQALSLMMPVKNQGGSFSHQKKILRVKIPKGVTEGQQIRLKGQGADGINAGPKGDLYLEIAIKPDKVFDLEQKTVLLTLPITPWEAALGAKIKVPTLGGNVDMIIPKGVESGKKMRLKGRGFPGTPPGDQIVIFQIKIPTPKTEKQKALYQEMEKEMPFNPREEILS